METTLDALVRKIADEYDIVCVGQTMVQPGCLGWYMQWGQAGDHESEMQIVEAETLDVLIHGASVTYGL